MLTNEEQIKKIIDDLGQQALVSTKKMEYTQFVINKQPSVNAHSYMIKLTQPFSGDELKLVVKIAIANIFSYCESVTDVVNDLKDVLESDAALTMIELDMKNDMTVLYFGNHKTVFYSINTYNNNVNLLKEYPLSPYTISQMLSFCAGSQLVQ
ncbi:hypothetical protein Kuja_0820 [Vibrio phage vB_VchM_Kuja]|uniref:Uncharacterized protein n=1 Tax=Vibrio phage vB_VchM_Kuja TaxID=2686437 RepID=A0A6B9J952_9CAUD|nr:hypothetical protein HWC83_gp154 [Vibrio phage vB_VchM_Kuja]QGZ16073.1 hypothetical protein Kuja_0820 [Vibrio phage vB_VchM_Kuja]